MEVELLNFVRKIHKNLYSFSYTLIPDDLQAQQLVLDAVSSLLIDQIEGAEGDLQLTMEKAREHLFMQIFKIAKKRTSQLVGGIESHRITQFEKLDFITRAVLYLAYKEDFEIGEIKFLTGIDSAHLELLLSEGRERLLDKPSKGLTPLA